MHASEARIIANRENSLKSTGPRTPEGKAVSRRNSFKHGLTGAGVVLPDEDVAAVSDRIEAFQADLKPSNSVAAVLVQRAALLSVRMDRCVRHEAAATTQRMLQADATYQHERLALVDHAHSFIAHEPATYARKLRSMPEGVDRIIANILALREELTDRRGGSWDWMYAEKLMNLLGLRRMAVPVVPMYAMAEAIEGRFELLRGEASELDDQARRAWARERMVELIDAEVEQLRTHRETLDPAAVESERAGAATREIFDSSKEAILARKYEAAAERAFYKALKELRQVEAEARAQPDASNEPEPLASFGTDEDDSSFASVSESSRSPGRCVDPQSWVAGSSESRRTTRADRTEPG